MGGGGNQGGANNDDDDDNLFNWCFKTLYPYLLYPYLIMIVFLFCQIKNGSYALYKELWI